MNDLDQYQEDRELMQRDSEPAATMECPHCHGAGRIYVEPGSSLRYCCPDCGGSGRVADPEGEE